MGSRWSGSELNGEPCQERTTSPLVCSQCYQLGMSISTDPAGICWFGTKRFDGTMAGKASADKPCAMPRQAATQTTVRNSRLLRESVYCHSFRFRAVHDRHWRRSAEALVCAFSVELLPPPVWALASASPAPKETLNIRAVK